MGNFAALAGAPFLYEGLTPGDPVMPDKRDLRPGVLLCNEVFLYANPGRTIARWTE
jgi:hypothetical protein